MPGKQLMFWVKGRFFDHSAKVINCDNLNKTDFSYSWKYCIFLVSHFEIYFQLSVCQYLSYIFTSFAPVLLYRKENSHNLSWLINTGSFPHNCFYLVVSDLYRGKHRRCSIFAKIVKS